MRKWHVGLVIFVVIATVSYLTLTVFVIQPIGALPEGKTLIIIRKHNLQFIDSADGFCYRNQDRVNLLCRMMILGTVIKDSPILLRLPYSETLYNISTGGMQFDR